ncbi:MAG: hypothetical protein IKB75_03225 [Clostridia bacterium]|nr:hypothetical protein [Clostridia bacterium]
MRKITVYLDDESGASLDALTVSAIGLYLFGFIGMFIMLFSIPAEFLFAGVIALIIYLLPIILVILALIIRPFVQIPTHVLDPEDEPITYQLCRMLVGGGGVFKNILRRFISPFSFVLFNILFALFWVCYGSDAVGESALIAIVIPGAYAMYYYPFVLIRNAIKQRSKLLGIVAAAIIFVSLALFLINYDRFMEADSVLGPAFFFSMLTLLGTLTILICKLITAKKKKRNVWILGIYLGTVAIVALSVL